MGEIWLGVSDTGEKVAWGLDKLNRHGLIAGATGTGKTVTLQVLAEQLSAQGVNVFLSDVKGDLGGLAAPSLQQGFVTERARQNGMELNPTACLVTLWDVAGKQGLPVRLTVAELGPVLLSRLLELTDVQAGVLDVVFAVAEAEGLLLLDLPDLRAALVHVAENAKQYALQFGQVSVQSVGAIQRSLLGLERQGGAALFGEPALDIKDLLVPAADGRGMVHILNASALMQTPDVYGVLLLFILSELFEDLPEAGDLPQPKLVLFFDEAHLLFKDASKALLEKVEQAVRLIRSKGVGVFFVTQQPSDVPQSVLAQLGNRVQHALRAATPQGQKDIEVAAKTTASNPAFDTAKVIPQLGVGEALVSGLDKKGVPTPVQRTLLNPPVSRVGPLNALEMGGLNGMAPLAAKYAQRVERESAAERLAGKLQQSAPTKGKVKVTQETTVTTMAKELLLGNGRRQGLVETATKTVVRQVASQVGRELLRGLLGGRKR